jgi:hypothetical protein
VGEDLGNRLRISQERDERERRLTGGADEGKDFIDPSQEDGPPGGPGGGGIRCLSVRFLWLGRLGGGGFWEGKPGTGELSGQGVILPGPGRDQGPQRSVGGEDPMVTVAVDAGWGEDVGQPIQKLQSRETQGGAAGEVGPRQDVEDLVGAVVDEVEAVEGKGGPGTVANDALQSGPVGGLDTDAGIETEPTPVIPGEHIFGLVGLQEPVAAKVSQDPGADRVLEVLQQRVGKVGGFVEAEAGFWIGRILVRVILDPLEEPINDAQMEMKVGVEAGAEAMEEAHGTHGCGLRGRGVDIFVRENGKWMILGWMTGDEPSGVG